jgi:hypothetical protein
VKTTSIAGIVAGLGGLFFLVFITITSSHMTSQQHPSGAETETQAVATAGTRYIKVAEVEQAVALSLYQVEEQRTKLLRESTQHLIEEELLATEAARVGVTVPELIESAHGSEAVAKLAGLPGQARSDGRDSLLRSRRCHAPFVLRGGIKNPSGAVGPLRRNTTIHIYLPYPE